MGEQAAKGMLFNDEGLKQHGTRGLQKVKGEIFLLLDVRKQS